VLHEGGRTSTGGRQRLRDILVAVQVGGSLTLLIIAGLFVRSLRGVQNSAIGFDPVHVLNLTLDPNEIGYTEVQGRAFYRAMLERTRALPGVESASLAAALGLLGLILAVVGVYGVMSYAVSQRTQEIGVRIALGAQKRDILRMIGRQGTLIVASGLTVGLLAALAVGRLVSDFLVGITPSDPFTYVGVSVLLATVACLATYIPTRRATKVDPMVALRYE
jgi:hypothetical protein